MPHQATDTGGELGRGKLSTPCSAIMQHDWCGENRPIVEVCNGYLLLAKDDDFRCLAVWLFSLCRDLRSTIKCNFMKLKLSQTVLASPSGSNVLPAE